MKSIFKWFTLADASARVEWFVNKYELTEFTGVDKLLVLFLDYCARLGIQADRKYLEAFLKTENKKLIKKFNIKLPTMDNFNYDEPASLEEATRVLASAVIEAYNLYTSIELPEGSNFKVDMQTFITEKKSERVIEVMSNAFPVISSGEDVDLTVDDMQYNLSRIQEMYDPAYLDKLDFLEGRVKSTTKKDVMRHLFNTGLPCVDGDAGGMFSKQLWALAGSPGSGKTRIACAHFAYRAILKGIDVLFDELEMSKIEIENMLIAHHIVHLFKGKVKIPDSVMNKDGMTEEQKRYYEAARIDLFESGKYGKIVIRTDDIIVENLEKDMYSYLRRNRNTQLWIVDYAGLARSKPKERYARHLDSYEIISELYRIAKDIAKNTDIGVLILNQFGKEGVEAARMGKRIIAGHVQGGQIIERHADYDLAMCMTEEQENAGMRTLSTVKKRGAKGFQFVPFSADCSVSIFRQLEQDVA